MAQYELKRSESKVLQHMQKVKTTYEINARIAERAEVCDKTVKHSLEKLERIGLITVKHDKYGRFVELTKLGNKHLVIIEETRISRWDKKK